jgi:hypothetical protein
MRNIRYIDRNGPYVRLTDVAIAIGVRDGSMLARRDINRKNLIHLEQETDKPTDNIKHSRIFGNETVIRELANKSKQLPRRQHLARLAGIMQAMKSEGQQVGSIVFDKEGFKFVAGLQDSPGGRHVGNIIFDEKERLIKVVVAAGLQPDGQLVTKVKTLGAPDDQPNSPPAPAKTKPQPAVDAAEEARQRFLRDSALVSPPAVARMAGMILSEACSELGGETPPTPAVVKEAIPVETVVTGGKTPPTISKEQRQRKAWADQCPQRRALAEQYVGRMLTTLPELNWPQAGNYRVIPESFDWSIYDPTLELWTTTVAVASPGKKNVRYLAGVRFETGLLRSREIVNGYLKEWPPGMKSVEFPDFPVDVQHMFERILKRPEVVDYGRSSLNPPANRQQMADQYVGGLLAAIPELKGSDYRPTVPSFDWSILHELLGAVVELAAPEKPPVRYLVAVRFSPGSVAISDGYYENAAGVQSSVNGRQTIPDDVRFLFSTLAKYLATTGVNESVPCTEPEPPDAEKIELYQEIALARRAAMPGTQELVIPNKDVAKALGVDESTLRAHKSKHPELIQGGTHWVVAASNTLGGVQDVLCWTKDGIIILVSELVQTPQAKAFLRKLLAAKQPPAVEVALKDDLQALKDDMRALSQQLLKERAPVTPPPMPAIDIQATIEKEVAEKTKLIEAHVESQAAAKVQLAIAAMRDDLSPSLEQSKLGRPDFLAESGTPDKRTINYRGDFSGDSVPEYCRHWAWPEKMVHNPNTDKRFAFPPGLSRLAGNGRPDGDFILLWMAEHMLVYRLTELNQEALEKLGHRRDWLWYPTELLNGLHEAGKKYWYKWDAVVSRVEPPAAGLPKEEIRGPKWRFSPVLLSHLSAIWEDDRQNGNLLALAAKIRPSWFTGSKCKHYLERLKIGTREELLKLVGETEADAKAGDHADHT